MKKRIEERGGRFVKREDRKEERKRKKKHE